RGIASLEGEARAVERRAPTVRAAQPRGRPGLGVGARRHGRPHEGRPLRDPVVLTATDGQAPSPQRRGLTPLLRQRGCGTIRMYGLGDCQPSGYFSRASSSETEPAITTSSPSFQLTGVATLWFAVSCSESTTRSTSSKLRPVVIGYMSISLIFLSGPMTYTVRTV